MSHQTISVNSGCFRWLCSATAFCALICGGCGHKGPTVAPVKGKVLLNGQPLSTGRVITLPSGGRGATGNIRSDGTFELWTFGENDGATIGTHKVGVSAFAPKSGGGAESGNGKSLVPARFMNPETSGLTVEVKASGDNAPELKLTSP